MDILIMLSKPSMAKMNRNGDKGSPCLRSLSERKKPADSSFIKIEYMAVLVQALIHFKPSLTKAHLMKNIEKEVPIDMVISLLSI